MEGLDTKFGHKLVDLKFERDHVVTCFNGGKGEEGNLITDADGIHTTV